MRKRTIAMWGILGFVAFTIYIGATTPEETEKQVSSQNEVAPAVTPEPVNERTEGYSIISDISTGDIKRSVDVLVDKKFTERELWDLAHEVKSLDSRFYEQTFILYYLPGMKPGAGAWASSHFTPKLEVNILGLSKEAEEQRKLTPVDPSRNVVGIWYDERPYVGATITIYKKAGKLFIESLYKDNSKSSEELNETQMGSGRRFDKVEKSSFGEYWLLTKEGELSVFDDEGLIVTYRSSNS